MRKYFNIYKEFFKTSATLSMSFRLNFILQSIMNLSSMLTFFMISSFIFDHIEYIGVWNKTEFFFFLSFVFAVEQTHYLFFSLNFWQLSEDVRLGNLDFHLLKPVSILFIVFTRTLAIPGVITILTSYALMIYFGLNVGLGWLSWLSIPFCIAISLILLVGIEVLISMFNFITIEGMAVNQVRLQVQHLCRWPDFIYKNPLRLAIIPFLGITSFPTRFLLNNHDWLWLYYMTLGTGLLLVLILWVWPKMLGLYESPSS